MSVDVSLDPRTGAAVAELPHSSPEEVEAAVAAAVLAAPALAAASPSERKVWLDALASALEADLEGLAALADRETGLGRVRLDGEVARAAGQLRFYASVAVEGSYLGATLDTLPDGSLLGRVNVPLGPVAVFGASNFPFAFSVLGNDTASALAAGCPVVVKAHPAHPELSARLAELALGALRAAGAPEGAFGMVSGFEAGTALVAHPSVRAVGFTGSEAGGTALWRLAQQRPEVIPVYAEMGTVNPVVVTPAASAGMAAIAAGFVGSFTLGTGQFCTKPGLLLTPAGADGPGEVAAALKAAAPSAVLLTEGIARAAVAGVEKLAAAGASVVAQVPGPEAGWTAPATVLTAPAAALVPGSPLLAEVFGPVAIVVEYTSVESLPELLSGLQGALAAGLFCTDDDEDAPALAAALAHRVGRVVANGWPTGVAFTWAQQHGGPWPSTTDPRATSVGAAALDRWVRPLALQSLPTSLLPPALAADNPWRLPRRLDGHLALP